MEELVDELKSFLLLSLMSMKTRFSHQLALNVIPHIDVFLENDYTRRDENG